MFTWLQLGSFPSVSWTEYSALALTEVDLKLNFSNSVKHLGDMTVWNWLSYLVSTDWVFLLAGVKHLFSVLFNTVPLLTTLSPPWGTEQSPLSLSMGRALQCNSEAFKNPEQRTELVRALASTRTCLNLRLAVWIWPRDSIRLFYKKRLSFIRTQL